MPQPHDTPKPTPFIQRCRDLVRMLSYEDILGCTVYLPPMLFMVGPASIVANNPLINLALNAMVGFALSGMLHRMGHRLLRALPNERQTVYLSRSLRLPVPLTLTHFLWMMESLVAAAVFSGIVGARFFLDGGAVGLVVSLICFTMALGLYFLPVHLAGLWIKRYYPAMPLLIPTEEEVSHALPRIRSLLTNGGSPPLQ